MPCLRQLATEGGRPRASHERMLKIDAAHQIQIMNLPKPWRKPKKVGLNHSFEGSEFDDSALQPDHGGMSSIVRVQF